MPLPTMLPPLVLPPAAGATEPAVVVSSVFSFLLGRPFSLVERSEERRVGKECRL